MPKRNYTIKKNKIAVPLLPLRNLTVFPHMVLHFDIGRPKSVMALERAMAEDQSIFLVSQPNPEIEDPTVDEVFPVGTISTIKQILKLPGGGIRVLVEGECRAKLDSVVDDNGFLTVNAKRIETTVVELDKPVEAVVRKAKELFEKYFHMQNRMSGDSMIAVMNVYDPGALSDVIASNIFTDNNDRQIILETFDPMERIENVIKIMYKETEILELERDISSKVMAQMEKNQREYFLREQLKIIHNELGDESVNDEIEDYKDQIIKCGFASDVEAKLFKEAERLSKIPQSTPEGGVIRTYLDTVLELPWKKKTTEKIDIQKAQAVLDEDHYGLEKVKQRIVEQLAVFKLTKDIKGSIICLVGPPGVGKTSIAKSIARSMGRRYVRMSLGGVRDEAEIRGHRKTYIGAMPGRIINAVKQAGTKNPLILLDEIDKLTSDFRGDPSAALLEVLDSAQNFAFRDHYIEVPFDLSKVFFMTTANTTESIPKPLLDRMEVIRLGGYTSNEKKEIAAKYLVPKQRKAHGLKATNLKITEDAIGNVIDYYTREAGVRELERAVSEICRKTAYRIENDHIKSVTVNCNNLIDILGKQKYRHGMMKDRDEIGIATGLAWTPVGGDVLDIEVNVMDGSGKVELTGSLGDVMKESAKTAISYIRATASKLGIDTQFYKNKDVHIHVPEGATPKDGPSAGITIATALISALTGMPVNRNIAMTGEITLRGRVLPIGGLKEKTLGAYRAGISNIIISSENEKDVDDIPPVVRESIRIITADNMDTVIANALKIEPKNTNPYFEHISTAYGEGSGIIQ